ARHSIRGVFCSLGAPPKWVLKQARPVGLGFVCADFPSSPHRWSPSACLSPSLVACCARALRGVKPPLRARARKSGRLQNPLRPPGTLYAIRIGATWPSKLGQVFIKTGIQEITKRAAGKKIK